MKILFTGFEPFDGASVNASYEAVRRLPASIAGAAVETALSPAFRQKAAGAKSPYDGGPTSARIVAALEQWAQSPAFGRPKIFYDAPCEEEKA